MGCAGMKLLIRVYRTAMIGIRSILTSPPQALELVGRLEPAAIMFALAGALTVGMHLHSQTRQNESTRIFAVESLSLAPLTLSGSCVAYCL